MRQMHDAADVARKLSITVRCLDFWIARGVFPRPDRQPTQRTRLWFADTVERWQRNAEVKPVTTVESSATIAPAAV